MKKPIDLRDHLARHIPELHKNPDKLHVFIDEGSIAIKRASAGAEEGSFEWRYTVTLLVTDYSDSPDTLIVPLIAWAETHQPDLFDDTKKRDEAIKIRAEIISHDAVDIELKLSLSERVVVRRSGAGWECEHVGEPQLPDLSGPTVWSINPDA